MLDTRAFRAGIDEETRRREVVGRHARGLARAGGCNGRDCFSSRLAVGGWLDLPTGAQARPITGSLEGVVSMSVFGSFRTRRALVGAADSRLRARCRGQPLRPAIATPTSAACRRSGRCSSTSSTSSPRPRRASSTRRLVSRAARPRRRPRAQLIKYLDSNKNWCNVPDDTVNNLKAADAKSHHLRRPGLQDRRSGVEQRKQATANPTLGVEAQKLPAGPL